jgi:hypothetical protein
LLDSRHAEERLGRRHYDIDDEIHDDGGDGDEGCGDENDGHENKDEKLSI